MEEREWKERETESKRNKESMIMKQTQKEEETMRGMKELEMDR